MANNNNNTLRGTQLRNTIKSDNVTKHNLERPAVNIDITKENGLFTTLMKTLQTNRIT